MLAICLLGLLAISEIFARQPPGHPPGLTNPSGLTVYRTGIPGPYLIQTNPRGPQSDVSRPYQQIAVVVVPRQRRPVLHTTVYPTEATGTGVTQEPNIHYKQALYGHQQSSRETQNAKPVPFVYPQVLPHPSLKIKTYPKPENPIQQYLKEVTPTTKTVYGEQHAASLRYALATAPPHPEQLQDSQNLTTERVTPQQFALPYAVRQQVQQDPNQQQQYQQIPQPQQYVQQPQDYVQSQQFVQPNPYSGSPQQFTTREDSSNQQPQKYQQPQNAQDSLTYIPINPVMFQKPLVDDDTPTPKSAIFVTQRTPVKKYRLQPAPTEESDDQFGKIQVSPKKLSRQQLQQYQPFQQIQPQQFLIPIIPQQPTAPNQEFTQVHHLQPQPIKYQIQQLQGEPLKYQQIVPEQVGEQQIYPQPRPKKVLPQIIRQQLPQQIIAYQQFPLPQPVPTESYQDQQVYQQSQQVQPVNILKQPLIRYQLQPQAQLLAIQPASLRHPQQTPETIEYEQVQQEPATQHQEPQPEQEKPEEKQEAQQPESTPPRLSAKYRKSSLRSRKYRPTPPRIHHEQEEESSSENHEHHQEYPEDFRIQYPDGLKPQATNFSGTRYRRPLQSNSKQSIRNNKDRAVQIIDEDDDEYK